MADNEGGVLFSADAADRIAESVKRSEGTPYNLPAKRRRTPVVSQPGVYTARVEGDADGDGNYPAVISLQDPGDLSFKDYGDMLVRPIDGGTLTVGTTYPVRPIGPAADGTLLYQALSADGASGIEVRGFDLSGSPLTIDGVTTLDIGQVTTADKIPLYIEDRGGGVVEILPLAASPTQWGMVTPDEQSFAGDKHFNRSSADSNNAVNLVLSGSGAPLGSTNWLEVKGAPGVFSMRDTRAGGSTIYITPSSVQFPVVTGGSVGGTVSGIPGGVRIFMTHGFTADAVDFVWNATAGSFMVQLGSLNGNTGVMVGTHLPVVSDTVTLGSGFVAKVRNGIICVD